MGVAKFKKVITKDVKPKLQATRDVAAKIIAFFSGLT